MLAEEVYGALRSYIAATLVGMGAQKGAPCTITSIVDGTDDHTITFGWKDNDGVEHTSTLIVKDGATGETGPTGATGAAGFSPTIAVKTNTATAYVMTITDVNGSYDTPNLKGGAAGATELSQLEDIVLASLADKDVLIYDSETSKWKNTALGAAAYSNDFEDLDNKPDLGTAAAGNSTSSVTEGSEDLLTSGGAFTALGQKANKGTSLSDYGITNAYTKTETNNQITTEIAKLDVSDSAVAGSYVTEVKEVDGKIAVTREAADAKPTASSKKMVESGGVYTDISNEAKTRGAMGAKNLMPFDLSVMKELNTSGTWTDNVYSFRGVDFTVNADGTITADGTATAGNASLKIYASSSSYEMLGKTVIMNGCPSGGGATSYRIQAYRMGSADGSSGTYFDDGEGTIAFEALNNASGTIGSFAVAVYENTEVNDLVFAPMVRLATDMDPTHQQYAKTNKQLTDEQGFITEDQWTAIQALLV